MFNELVFIIYGICISGAALGAALISEHALVALLCLEAVLMNLFVTKLIVLCGLTATASDVLGVGGVICLNLIQEFYGPRLAKQAVWLAFGAMSFFAFVSWLHCLYIPSFIDSSQQHFDALLHLMPRLICASLIAYLTTQMFDRWLYEKFAILSAGRYFVARNVGGVALTQMLDTIIFGMLGLYGVLPHLGHVLLVSYVIKLAALAVSIPCIALAKRLCY